MSDELHPTSWKQTNERGLGQAAPNGDTIYESPEDLFDIFDVAMRRPRVDWIELEYPPFSQTPGEANDRFIQFGGENKILWGYREVNYPEWNAEDLMAPLPFETETVASIVCIHTVDHLSSAAVQHWLEECERILEHQGVITIVVPHFMSTLAHECIEHKTQYGLKTWRNLLGGGNDVSVDYRPEFPSENHWRESLKVGFNMVMGLEERNLVQVTQLIKK